MHFLYRPPKSFFLTKMLKKAELPFSYYAYFENIFKCFGINILEYKSYQPLQFNKLKWEY